MILKSKGRERLYGEEARDEEGKEGKEEEGERKGKERERGREEE